MKNPELPSPSSGSRPYVPRIVDPIAPADEPEEKFQPRYVEVPALREHGFGRRNLVWGVFTLAIALALLVAAVIVAGQKAVLSLAACLFTFTVLFVLARMHVFRQRNGGFLAVAVVVLLGAVMPLIDRSYEMLAGISRQALPANQASGPVARPVDAEPPLLTLSFALEKPDPTQPQVRVIKDSRVVIAEKPFIIKAGDVFPLVEAKAGEATFAVRDLRVSLPVTVVEIVGGKSPKEAAATAATPVKETREAAVAAALAAVKEGDAPAAGAADASPKPASATTKVETAAQAELLAITRISQTEAMRRYPALAVKDSVENQTFVSAYRQLRDGGNADFFSNPEWPIELAEKLALRDGWTRGDKPEPAPEAAPTIEPPMTDDAPAATAVPQAPAARAARPAHLPPASEDDPPQIPRR